MLGYKVPESAASLKSQWLYHRIPHLHQPRYRLREVAEHRLEDAVWCKRFLRSDSLGNAVTVVRWQIFINQFYKRYFILLFTSVPAPVPLYLLWAVLKLYLMENFILWVSIRLV